MKGRELAETLLMYVGVPALTLYPLGFVALGIEMLRDPFFPSFNFDATWNAVSLVPQTVVIGTGVRLLYLSLISTALGVSIAAMGHRFFRRALRQAEGTPVPVPLSGWWRLYAVVLLPVAAFLLWNNVTVSGWRDVWYVAGFFVLSTGSGIAIGYAWTHGHRDSFFFGLAVAYAGSILAGLCVAAIQDPQLPLVEIDAEVGEAAPCSKVPAAKLYVALAETEAYWHIYNEDGLLAIPHQEAGIVRYRDCPGYAGGD